MVEIMCQSDACQVLGVSVLVSRISGMTLRSPFLAMPHNVINQRPPKAVRCI